jgi:hypothetical protein
MLAQAVDRLVARQRHQPGDAAGLGRVEARGAAPHGGIGFLQHLFGLAAIAQHAQAHAKQLGRGPLVQLGECLLVATTALQQQPVQLIALDGGAGTHESILEGRVIYPGRRRRTVATLPAFL